VILLDRRGLSLRVFGSNLNFRFCLSNAKGQLQIGLSDAWIHYKVKKGFSPLTFIVPVRQREGFREGESEPFILPPELKGSSIE